MRNCLSRRVEVCDFRGILRCAVFYLYLLYVINSCYLQIARRLLYAKFCTMRRSTSDKPFLTVPAVAGIKTSERSRSMPFSIQEVLIENDSDRKYSKSKICRCFSENHFSPRFMLPCSLLAENIFLVFQSPHPPLDTQFWTRGFSW